MPEIDQTVRQWSLIQQWIESLRQLSAIEVVWLEGSLARGQGNPSSDIDIRFGIADVEYGKLWKEDRSPAEVWPVYDELTVDVVRGLTNMHLLLMASGAAPLYNGELHSARFQLDDLRTELIQIMYRRLGLTYAKRFKHFSEIFPTEWLIDLDKTYMSPGTSPLDVNAMAEAYIHLFAIIGKHLQALSDKAGGGFEPIWYFNLANLVEEQFRHFIPPSAVR